MCRPGPNRFRASERWFHFVRRLRFAPKPDVWPQSVSDGPVTVIGTAATSLPSVQMIPPWIDCEAIDRNAIIDGVTAATHIVRAVSELSQSAATDASASADADASAAVNALTTRAISSVLRKCESKMLARIEESIQGSRRAMRHFHRKGPIGYVCLTVLYVRYKNGF